MSRTTKLCTLAALGMLALIGTPRPAHAQWTTTNFDDVTDGDSPIDHRYGPRFILSGGMTQGVTFSSFGSQFVDGHVFAWWDNDYMWHSAYNTISPMSYTSRYYSIGFAPEGMNTAFDEGWATVRANF